MKKSELKAKLEKGFNAQIMAELCDCSIGRINELKREVAYEQIAEHFNLNVDEFKQYVQSIVNVEAIFRFCEKHEIDVEAWDDEIIEKATSVKERVKSEGLKVEVGTVLPNNEKIVKIIKNGNSWNYVTEQFNVFNQKQIIEMYK